MFKTLLFVCYLVTVSSYAQDVDSLDIKIGQMIMVGHPGQAILKDDPTLAEIREGKVGGIVLFEKNIDPKNSYIKFKQLTWSLQHAAPLPLF
ncbi:MAG: glycoside hydrolase family 3 protein, partial [Bacteroidota bacterium]